MKVKGCSICFKEIDLNTNYGVFKYNQLFALKGPRDIWSALTKRYICADCLKKIQKYCQEES